MAGHAQQRAEEGHGQGAAEEQQGSGAPRHYDFRVSDEKCKSIKPTRFHDYLQFFAGGKFAVGERVAVRSSCGRCTAWLRPANKHDHGGNPAIYDADFRSAWPVDHKIDSDAKKTPSMSSLRTSTTPRPP